MSHLLDSNVLLWWLAAPASLSNAARAAISNPAGLVHVSSISVYELQVKARKGLLRHVPESFEVAIRGERFLELPMTIAHAEAAAALPMHHRDPWDRLLIAQARVEGFSIVSSDRVFVRYGVRVVW